ncbi:uncharacterized protein TNCV_2781741 [Trichonephila clavipes]|nr:uncharacterized protein TNCV_2781741 [Trichonephila clavipes]
MGFEASSALALNDNLLMSTTVTGPYKHEARLKNGSPLTFRNIFQGCGSPVVKVSDHDRHVMSSSPVPLKTHRVGQRCTLNLSRTETSSCWCDVVVRRESASLGVVYVS